MRDGERPLTGELLTVLFKAFDIPYRSVDLDSAEYQKGNWGGQIRNVLKARTGQPTIPQIFVGGQHIGGCTDTLDAFASGVLQRDLTAAGVAFGVLRDNHAAVDAISDRLLELAASVPELVTMPSLAPEMVPRLFGSFSQAEQSLDRSKGGLGLGLVGLMIACMMSALMSTADCQMITAAGLLGA